MTGAESLCFLDGTQWEKHASLISASPGPGPPQNVINLEDVDYLLGRPSCLQSRQSKREWSIAGIAFGCEKPSPSIPTVPLVSEEQLMRRFLLFILMRHFMSYRISPKVSTRAKCFGSILPLLSRLPAYLVKYTPPCK